MTIKLKSGRVVEREGFQMSISDGGDLRETDTGYDPEAREDHDGVVAGALTPDERRELAQVMMERWAKWGGVGLHGFISSMNARLEAEEAQGVTAAISALVDSVKAAGDVGLETQMVSAVMSNSVWTASEDGTYLVTDKDGTRTVTAKAGEVLSPQQPAPTKLLVVPEAASDGCVLCPFCKGEESMEWCAADDPEQRDVDVDQPRPGWCPLRSGDVVVRMQKREAT